MKLLSNIKKIIKNSIQPYTMKNTYLLVHSAWLGAWQWEAVAKLLTNQGHTVLTPDLPGHGADTTPASEIGMEHYIDTLGQILLKQEHPVILVGHSFNGITISQIAELYPRRVQSLVYIAGFLLPNGASFLKAVQGVTHSKAVTHFSLSADGTEAYVADSELQNAFAHDIPASVFNAAKKYIVPEPAAPLQYELRLSDENFGSIPKYYIECTDDQALPIDIQRAMYQNKVRKVYSLATSHTPNFSAPEELATILSKIEA